MSEMWNRFAEAVDFAVSHIEGDQDPLNDRERADADQYVMRILAAVTGTAMMRLDPDRPTFLPMLDAVRYVGAAGPDIDYDVAAVRPGGRYRITGRRGTATYVGIAVYEGAGEAGATAIVLGVDVDELVEPDGTFGYEFEHPGAARVIIRQYFHDRGAQTRGEWAIERVDATFDGTMGLPTPIEMEFRAANVAKSIRWNAQLNELWTPALRRTPNTFVRQSSDDIVAAVPNPDVVYSTAWWRKGDDEVVVIEVTPPSCRYWGIQLCDRWFQCYPDRRSNLNDRQIVTDQDGSIRIVIADGDPGHPNWLDAGGHRTGVAFFRWLHSDVDVQPVCSVTSVADFARTFATRHA